MCLRLFCYNNDIKISAMHSMGKATDLLTGQPYSILHQALGKLITNLFIYIVHTITILSLVGPY